MNTPTENQVPVPSTPPTSGSIGEHGYYSCPFFKTNLSNPDKDPTAAADITHSAMYVFLDAMRARILGYQTQAAAPADLLREFRGVFGVPSKVDGDNIDNVQFADDREELMIRSFLSGNIRNTASNLLALLRPSSSLNYGPLWDTFVTQTSMKLGSMVMGTLNFDSNHEEELDKICHAVYHVFSLMPFDGGLIDRIVADALNGTDTTAARVARLASAICTFLACGTVWYDTSKAKYVAITLDDVATAPGMEGTTEADVETRPAVEGTFFQPLALLKFNTKSRVDEVWSKQRMGEIYTKIVNATNSELTYAEAKEILDILATTVYLPQLIFNTEDIGDADARPMLAAINDFLVVVGKKITECDWMLGDVYQWAKAIANTATTKYNDIERGNLREFFVAHFEIQDIPTVKDLAAGDVDAWPIKRVLDVAMMMCQPVFFDFMKFQVGYDNRRYLSLLNTLIMYLSEPRPEDPDDMTFACGEVQFHKAWDDACAALGYITDDSLLNKAKGIPNRNREEIVLNCMISNLRSGPSGQPQVFPFIPIPLQKQIGGFIGGGRPYGSLATDSFIYKLTAFGVHTFHDFICLHRKLIRSFGAQHSDEIRNITVFIDSVLDAAYVMDDTEFLKLCDPFMRKSACVDIDMMDDTFVTLPGGYKIIPFLHYNIGTLNLDVDASSEWDFRLNGFIDVLRKNFPFLDKLPHIGEEMGDFWCPGYGTVLTKLHDIVTTMSYRKFCSIMFWMFDALNLSNLVALNETIPVPQVPPSQRGTNCKLVDIVTEVFNGDVEYTDTTITLVNAFIAAFQTHEFKILRALEEFEKRKGEVPAEGSPVSATQPAITDKSTITKMMDNISEMAKAFSCRPQDTQEEVIRSVAALLGYDITKNIGPRDKVSNKVSDNFRLLANDKVSITAIGTVLQICKILATGKNPEGVYEYYPEKFAEMVEHLYGCDIRPHLSREVSDHRYEVMYHLKAGR